MPRRTILLSVLLLLVLNGLLLACPMCKDALTQGDPSGVGALPNGFNTSIEIMLGGFLLTVTLVAGIIWKSLRG
jgi:hypothetical protein